MLSGLCFHLLSGVVVHGQLFDFETISFVVNLVSHTSEHRLGTVPSSLLVLVVVREGDLGVALVR